MRNSRRAKAYNARGEHTKKIQKDKPHGKRRSLKDKEKKEKKDKDKVKE